MNMWSVLVACIRVSSTAFISSVITHVSVCIFVSVFVPA